MSTIRANNIQGLDAPNPAIELPIDGTVILASGFSGDLESKGSFTASGLTVDSTATFAVGASGTPAITASGDPNTGIYFPAADTIGFAEGGNEAARIDDSGRVLIGTNTARRRFFNADGEIPTLQIEGTGVSTRGLHHLSLTTNNTSSNAGAGAFAVFGRSRGGLNDYTVVNNGDAIGSLSFQAADGADLVEAARITAFVDGTPAANDMPGRLIFSCTPASTSTVTDRMRLRSSGGFSNFCDSSDNFIVRNAMTGTGGTPFRVLTGASNLDDGTEQLVIRADGDVENTNGSYTQLSDASLKENIVDANSQWSDIKQLQIRNFNFKESTGFSTHTQLGLVAQEVETVCPGLVKTRDRIVNEKTGETVPTKSVNLSVLYMKAVKALQEAMTKIETLETANASQAATIATLDARLTALESA